MSSNSSLAIIFTFGQIPYGMAWNSLSFQWRIKFYHSYSSKRIDTEYEVWYAIKHWNYTIVRPKRRVKEQDREFDLFGQMFPTKPEPFWLPDRKYPIIASVTDWVRSHGYIFYSTRLTVQDLIWTVHLILKILTDLVCNTRSMCNIIAEGFRFIYLAFRFS